jgi:hypothetical protein
LILKSSEGKNPYPITFHREDCPEYLWENDAELIAPRELSERRCDACSNEWQLWTTILKHTADETTDPVTLYGDLANRGFHLHRKVAEFHYPIRKLSAFDYELLLIVQAEIKRREAFKIWEHNRKMEQTK